VQFGRITGGCDSDASYWCLHGSSSCHYSKLPAVETLGGATVICSDKTGTLTENQMTVQAIYAGVSGIQLAVCYAPEGKILREDKPVALNSAKALQECLTVGVLCNPILSKNGKWVVMGDPTEGALVLLRKAGLIQSALEQEMPKLDAIPFESEFQYMATLHETPVGKTIYVRGSVEAILKRCTVMLNSAGQPQ